MVDVTSLGDVNIDILSEAIENTENEQELIDNIKIKIGGGAAIFASHLSKLGMKVRLIGCVGNDFFGSLLKDMLKSQNLDLRLKTLNERTGITIGIQFKDGRKKLATFRGTNKIFSIKDINLSDIEGEILHFSGYNLLENLRKDISKIFEEVKNKDMVISFDPDLKAGLKFDKKEFFETAKFVDIMFLNETEASLISKNFDWFKGRCLVIKRGSKGAIGFEKGEKVEIEGLKASVKNPTGAGDVFNAAFIHHYYYGYDLRECLEFANEEAVKYLEDNYEA
ncbi:MAG: carbohydrate kinase family protein [Candidatus Aenigmatarchaeota archaeon]